MDLHPRGIQATYRIPSRPNSDRPVLLKDQHSNSKSKLMRVRVAVKSAGHRLVDDITKLNSKLISDQTKTNFVQFLGLKQAIKEFAKNYKTLHFTRNLSSPFRRANILFLIKPKKGCKDLTETQINPPTRLNGTLFIILRKNLGILSILRLFKYI